MSKAKKAKAGRPKGTGAGYTHPLRVLLRPATVGALREWAGRNGATSLSEAGRRIIEAAVSASGG